MHFRRSVVATLVALPTAAQAHGIHPVWIAAVLSPVAVMLLTVILGWLSRSVRLGAIHAMLIVLWVVLFWLASYLVTNDYLIWTPLALYLIHATIIILLVIWHAIARIGGAHGRKAPHH
jgi:hypothetical protein